MMGTHRRFTASAQQHKSIDDLPGDSDQVPTPEEFMRIVTDSVALFGEKYEEAKQQGLSSPMMKGSFGGTTTVTLMSHDAVKQWHQYELQGRVRRGGFPEMLTQVTGKAFNDMSGPDHAEWRKKAMPSFKPDMIGTFAPFVQRSAQNIVLDGIRRETEHGDAVQFCPLAKRFAFEIGAKFVFGPLLNDEEREYMFTLFQKWTHGLRPEVFGSALQDPENPGAEWETAVRDKAKVNEYLSAFYLEAEQLTATNSWDSKYGDDSECIVRSMMENDAIFKQPDYTLTDLVDFFLLILGAAYDTSATSLTNMIYTMWQNPEETEKVRAAIMAHPELSDPDTVFTFDMLKGCNELECFIKESMRVHSIIPAMAPRVIHDEEGVEIGGYHLPKGTAVTIPVKFLHQGEGSWTDPMEFRPSRFDTSQGQKRADRGSIGSYNHIPFATGLHKCLGQHLAMLELRMYTALLLRDWEFELDESRLTEEGTVNHMDVSQSFPHYNVYLKLKKRQK